MDTEKIKRSGIWVFLLGYLALKLLPGISAQELAQALGWLHDRGYTLKDLADLAADGGAGWAIWCHLKKKAGETAGETRDANNQ